MNITSLYKQLTEGKISKDFFMKNARINFPQYVSPTTTYDDAVKILKGKRVISESTLEEAYEVHYSDGIRQAKKFKDPKSAMAFAKHLISTNKALKHVDVFKAGPNFHSTSDANALVAWWGPGSYFDNASKADSSISAKQIKEDVLNEAHKLTTAQIIDRLNPYHFRKGVEFEVSKVKELNDEIYEKIREKVAKKMQKNPMAYEDQVFANAKDVEKKDEALHTQKVESAAKVDKKNGMKVKKKDAKANTRASKKENRSGHPKGVKKMTYNAKKAKGISQTMEMTGKEKVLSALKESLTDLTETLAHDYTVGREVHTPEGKGVIRAVSGGTLSVELDSGDTKDFQINVVDKATRDSHFSKMPDLGASFEKFKDAKDEASVSQYGNIIDKQKDAIKKDEPGMESESRLKEILKKILQLPEMKDVIKKLKETTFLQSKSKGQPLGVYDDSTAANIVKQSQGKVVPTKL